MNISIQLERETNRRHAAAALSLPADVVQTLCERAIEAVQSGEPHKPTGGWVAMPFMGKHSTVGLLYAASKAVRAAQAATLIK